MIDRRRNKRHQSQKGAIVMHRDNIGEILNLSMSGLLCQCIVNQNLDEKCHDVQAGDEFDLYCGHDHCHLQKVQFKRVSHWTGSEEKFCFARIRKCGVEFVELSEDQKKRLKTFITNHTVL